MAVLSMCPQGNLHLIAYLCELLKAKRPERQKNTFCIPTPGKPGKPEDHNPIQTGILKKLFELKEKEKLNP